MDYIIRKLFKNSEMRSDKFAIKCYFKKELESEMILESDLE